MIKELQLERWKSFSNATLYIDPLTILIGANAAGKSNTLDALLFLQRVSSGVGLFQAINGDTNIPRLRGGSEWVCLKPETSFSLSVLVGSENDEIDYRYSLTVAVNGTKAEIESEQLDQVKHHKRSNPKVTKFFDTGLQGGPAISAYFNTGRQGKGKVLRFNRSHTILSQSETASLRKEVLEAIKHVSGHLQRIFVFDPIPSHMRDYTPLSEHLLADGSNIAGVLAGLAEPRQTEVMNKLTGYLSQLPEGDIQKVWTELIGKFGTDAMLYCKEAWRAGTYHIIDARGMSDGTLRFLAIITAMLTREVNSLLVIEEVDNGLHPHRAEVLINMLLDLGRERQIDVIVTTHNPALLDAAGPRLVPFITAAHRDHEQGASRLTPIEDLEHLAKLLAQGSLGRLSAAGYLEDALEREGAR